MVTASPTAPDAGASLLIFDAPMQVTPLLACPLTVTTAFPVVAPAGTGAAMLVALQLLGVAAVPLKLFFLIIWRPPRSPLLPYTTLFPSPDAGARLLIFGATVKVTPLLACPLTVTTTFPVVAPAGTGAAMLVALQLLGVAAVPLKLTVLLP